MCYSVNILEAYIEHCLCLQTGDDKTFRRSPSWRKRFRAREGGAGLGMMAGSMETLPAGFRMPSMSVPPSMSLVPKKQLQPEGVCVDVCGGDSTGPYNNNRLTYCFACVCFVSNYACVALSAWPD